MSTRHCQAIQKMNFSDKPFENCSDLCVREGTETSKPQVIWSRLNGGWGFTFSYVALKISSTRVHERWPHQLSALKSCEYSKKWLHFCQLCNVSYNFVKAMDELDEMSRQWCGNSGPRSWVAFDGMVMLCPIVSLTQARRTRKPKQGLGSNRTDLLDV